MKSKYVGRSNDRIAASNVTSLPADLSHLQLASETNEQVEQVFNDTKLWNSSPNNSSSWTFRNQIWSFISLLKYAV